MPLSLRTITLNFDACRHNLKIIRQQLKEHTKIMVCVKANAYGHDLQSLAYVLADVDGLAVSDLSNAIRLRQFGFKNTILLMSNPGSPQLIDQIIRYQIDWVLFSQQQLTILSNHPSTQPINLWVKINSGMNRLGFAPQEIDQVMQTLANCKQIQQPGVLMTHLAEAEQGNPSFTLKQLAQFDRISAQYPHWKKSVANSAALFNYPTHQYDWVRPGIMIYGASSLPARSAQKLQLQPVMQLTATLIDIKTCLKGDSIGYNRRWICPHDTKIGIVAIGYGDGYPRNMPNGTPTLIRATTCAVIGRVSMDLIFVDLTPCPQANIGDQVTIWGDSNLPIENVADYAGTSAYELMCHQGSNQRMSTHIIWQGETYDASTWLNKIKERRNHSEHPPKDTLPPPLKAVLWKTRRGKLELDALLHPFCTACYSTLSHHNKLTFISLLDQSDPDLLRQILYPQEAPSQFQPLIHQIKTHYQQQATLKTQQVQS
jgi:alanine racemase